MTGIENVYFGTEYVAPICIGFFDLEGRVEATPQYEEPLLVAAKPLLPCGIASDVGPVVIEQVRLDVALAWTAQERELVGPEVWVVQRYVRASSHVALASGVQGKEVRAEGRSLPERSAQKSRRVCQSGPKPSS